MQRVHRIPRDNELSRIVHCHEPFPELRKGCDCACMSFSVASLSHAKISTTLNPGVSFVTIHP